MVAESNTRPSFLTVKAQPKMGFVRTLSITVISIRYRLFRSIIIVGVIAVAVSFLMNVLTGSLIEKAVVHETADKMKEYRQAAAWVARLSIPSTIEETLQQLAISQRGDAFCTESQTIGNFSDDEMQSYHNGAQETIEYLTLLTDLNYGRRRRLIHNATSTEIFDRLQNPEEMERFTQELKEIKLLYLFPSMDGFRQFLKRWPEIKKQTIRVQQNRAQAMAVVKENLRGRSVVEALTDADGEFGNMIRATGFALDLSTAKIVVVQAKQILKISFLEKTIVNPQMRQLLSKYLNVPPLRVTTDALWDLLRHKESASWYLTKLKEQGFDSYELDAEQLADLARVKQEEALMDQVERTVGGDIGGGFMGLGKRMTWLALVSMLVCIVGIANAMLMSVAERFREIAILKCLGALDGFIALMFVLEACILGIIGGLSGAIIGTFIGTGRMMASLGSLVISSMPVTELLMFMGLATLLGVVLAAVAAIYPSIKVARLAPMEAMRIE